MQWLTGRQVQKQLGITNDERRKLVDADLLTVLGHAGRSTLHDAESVNRLANLKPCEPESPAIAVRLGSPWLPDEPDQWPTGWHQGWDERTKADAARGFWSVADPDALIDGTLIAVVSVVAVAQWTILDYQRIDNRVIFEVTPYDWQHYLLRLGGGAFTKIF